MKTADMKRALDRGDIDAGILVNLEGLEDYNTITLFYEQFLAYVAENDKLFEAKSIKATDLNNEFCGCWTKDIASETSW